MTLFHDISRCFSRLIHDTWMLGLEEAGRLTTASRWSSENQTIASKSSICALQCENQGGSNDSSIGVRLRNCLSTKHIVGDERYYARVGSVENRACKRGGDFRVKVYLLIHVDIRKMVDTMITRLKRCSGMVR